VTGEWRFKARRTSAVSGGGWMAWCAKTDDLKNGPLEIDDSIEVHFEFGATEEEALSKLKRSLPQ